ncbi:DUF188 domain-containing protein [Erysipelothrix urinaevulpis]|uniref:YaiI/YqxD family protein n=1 Tax=Erysipelothrix urinaevulpis TaxID=2683717 RepID=UPI00135ADCDA|nr:DUF188 domain-containing protein [Erysipelothrix urinaevulpis]
MIYIDADGCPVVNITIDLAYHFQIPVTLVKNYAHDFFDDYATIITVDIGPDSVDHYIANVIKPNDILITQDYGLAGLALSKNAIAMNQNGLVYTAYNIDALLAQRHMNAKLRKQKIKHSNPKKRTLQNDHDFEDQLLKIITKKTMSTSI